MPTPKLANIHQLTREISLWSEHYRRWNESPVATPETQSAFTLLDKTTQAMVELFGDPSDSDE